ncbi:hypothetical protein [Fusobacterium sp.]|jgi:hypothetical protein|uniref:hypothetical protein n=1 Tax=Fusobacterium sp. TaxID=68766 RepID=UPI0026168316|nr:hypothetical protein [Fusobacterium sp.]
MINEVIEGLPLHFQKENNIKIYKSLEPVVDYLNDLIECLKGQTSLMKAKGIFLDFLGVRYQESRNGRDDEQYRKALVSKRMAVSGLPTTEFLLDIARQLSGAEVIDFKTRYKGEVASQYFKVDVNMDFSKINKFPNLNKICEAGARMYWELGFSEENTEIKVASTVGVSKIIEIGADFDIDRTVHVNGNINYVSGLALSKIIEIR